MCCVGLTWEKGEKAHNRYFLMCRVTHNPFTLKSVLTLIQCEDVTCDYSSLGSNPLRIDAFKHRHFSACARTFWLLG